MSGSRRVQLRDILSPFESGVSVNGEARPASAGEVGVLKVSCVRGGSFFPQENKLVVARDLKRVAGRPRRGDILISRANTPDLVGECGLVEEDYPNLFLPDKVWRTVPTDPERDDSRWIVGVLCSSRLRVAIKARATGTSAGMKNISQDSFLSIRVPRPPIAVQREMGSALRLFSDSERALVRAATMPSRLRL